jgi:hypothetical protein
MARKRASSPSRRDLAPPQPPAPQDYPIHERGYKKKERERGKKKRRKKKKEKRKKRKKRSHPG